jgi:hypothetical protein
MRSTLWAALFLVWGLASAAPPAAIDRQPSEAAVQEQVRRLDRKKGKAERIDALKWLNGNSRTKHAGLAIPALEQCIHDDPAMEVRREAVLDLALIAKNRKSPCPVAVIEAMLDREEEVRWQASACAGLFKTFDRGSVDVLLRCSRSEDASLRSDSLILLVRAAGKDKRVVQAIEKAKQDKTFQVRHTAHCALFLANDRMEDFLRYIIHAREEPDAVLSPAPQDAEARKREQAMRNLFLLGSAMRMIEWSDERADELASVLVKLLADKSPVMRRGAANLVGAVVVKTDLAAPGMPDDSWVFKILPYIEQDDLYKKMKGGEGEKKPPEKSKVAIQLEKLKVVELLRRVRDDDPDRSVREAARTALERLARVQEKKR